MPSARVIGIDAGGTKLLTGVADADLAVHHRSLTLWRGGGRQETVDAFVDAARSALEVAPDAAAVGVGIPSLVDRRGRSVWSNHLPIDDIPFADLLSERLGLPVVVDNDANAAAVAEHRRGAARGAEHAVMLALGTGAGSGLVLDGRLYRGAHGFAGELGHLVLNHDGQECPGACPGRGCLEWLVSGAAIGREADRLALERPATAIAALEQAGEPIAGHRVTALALDGDPDARAVLAEVGHRLGSALCGIVNVLDPEVVVLGGGALAAGDLLLDPAREMVARRALPPVAAAVRIVAAEHGEDAGMLGAALLALDRVGA